MIDNSVEDFLSHHGVKGMRWGVRNKGRTGNSLHPDNVLNYLYRKMGRIAQKDPIFQNPKNSDAAMHLLDRILERRVQIKELPKSVLGGSNKKSNVRKKRIATAVAIGGGIAATALVSSMIARKGMVPVSQLQAKELQLVRIQHVINKAQHSWNNPVRRNQREALSTFVKRLDMSG